MVTTRWRKEYCGLGSWRPQFLQPLANIQCFTVFASLIVAVQGIYLGYMIGVLTTIEKRFEIPSAWSGALLSVYDIGHALSVLLVGHYGSRLHHPKWIGAGSYLSSLACFGLFIPHLIFGEHRDPNIQSNTTSLYVDKSPICVWTNTSDQHGLGADTCLGSKEKSSNQYAYIILVVFQLVAGIASSPFTTLTYVYIDDNCTRKQSPFYMGVMTAMWAYGPALGFGLSSYSSQLWISLGQAPNGITADNSEWVGAWWLGLVVLCILYVIVGTPFLFYPRTLKRRRLPISSESTGEPELMTLRDLTKANSYVSRKDENTVKWCMTKLAEIPLEIICLVRNPMFLSLTMSWCMGAYVFGGYSTFLPKYLEVVFHQPTFIANILGGIVAVMGVATSTAIGGKVLTFLNPKASKALMFVVVMFVHSLGAFILLMFIACDNPLVNGMMPHEIKAHIDSNTFANPICAKNTSIEIDSCVCNPLQYSPICDHGTGQTYFSPCYLGCNSARLHENSSFENCYCASSTGPVESGACPYSCGSKLTMYLIGSFLGGTVGAFFQMALFTNLIWAVPKEKKTNAVALSNFFMSVLGFMPSQVIYGKIFDSTCTAWSVDQNSSCDSGYCLLYNNRLLRFRYHATTSAFQFAALSFVLIAHFISRNFKFPKHDDEDNVEQNENGDLENTH